MENESTRTDESDQPFTRADRLNIKYSSDPQVMHSAASLLLPHLVVWCLEIGMIFHVLMKTSFSCVCLESSLMYLNLHSLNDLIRIWAAIKDAINQVFQELLASNQLNFRSSR